jgi:superfamily II DNA helicase RecQ
MIDVSDEGVVLETCVDVLREVFGYDAFRGPQAEIVGHVSTGGDALVLMPTGGGKSLCYQIPAIVRQRAGQGVSIVVSPLIALMHDQVGALLEAGVAAAFLNSTLSSEESQAVEKSLLRGEITLLYVAPERLNTPRFLALLDSLVERGQLALFAIDEAHCVSQWGHDFRPEYRSLAVLAERFPGVPRVALTATADALTRDDMIERLPEGYATEVGENGVNLSVGQRQLLSFARALLADPRILILDEATSSVDTETEQQIQQAMATLRQGRTAFVIAHRLSTIRHADRILVIDHGRILEYGTHAELLARRGRYFDLYLTQFAQRPTSAQPLASPVA